MSEEFSERLPTPFLPANSEVDADTVRAAINGDKEAFSLLFMQTYRSMYAVVRQYLHRDADISDALQIGYTKAWKYITKLDPPENFVPWLRRIMSNAARDVLRDLYEHAADELAAEVTGEDDAALREQALEVRAALHSLPPEQVRILIMYYYDGLKLREIAALEHIPLSTAHHRLSRARRCLLEALYERGIDSPVLGVGVAGAVSVLLRTAIGNDILSVVAAQEILAQVLEDSAAAAAVRHVLLHGRDRAVWRMLLLVAGTAAAVVCAVMLLSRWGQKPPALPSANAPTVAQTTAATASTQESTASSQESTAPTQTQTQTQTVTASTVATTAASSVPTVPAFVPDYREGFANTRTNGDIVRALSALETVSRQTKHFLDFQDGWIYSTDGYKRRADGTGSVVRFCTAPYLKDMTVVGDWVYYIGGEGIMRVRTDGDITQCVVAFTAQEKRYIDGFFVYEDTLFYSLYEENGFHEYTPSIWEHSLHSGESVRLELDGVTLRGAVELGGLWAALPESWWSFEREWLAFDPATRSIRLLDSALSRQLRWYDLSLMTVGDMLYGTYFDDFNDGVFSLYSYDAVAEESFMVALGEADVAFSVAKIEYADVVNGRLAVMLYGTYPVEPLCLRWLNIETRAFEAEAPPEALCRTSIYQRYQIDESGRVYRYEDQGDRCTLQFSCLADGGDWLTYS